MTQHTTTEVKMTECRTCHSPLDSEVEALPYCQRCCYYGEAGRDFLGRLTGLADDLPGVHIGRENTGGNVYCLTLDLPGGYVLLGDVSGGDPNAWDLGGSIYVGHDGDWCGEYTKDCHACAVLDALVEGLTQVAPDPSLYPTMARVWLRDTVAAILAVIKTLPDHTPTPTYS